MSSPIIFGGNNIASNLQNALRMANGKLITDNGPYNLIPYAQLESGLSTGWSLGTATLTSNFPSGAPTFGSGASGNLSLSASSSNPILGAYSLLYQSSAATTAGNFVASDQFSIPFEMQGKVLSFKIAYNCSGNPANANFSGTSSNSYGVAFWDATNSTWIQPAGVFNLVQNSGVGIATGTVQPPSTCLAGRLVIYNANASAGAITMTFDDFYCGLQTTSIGPAMSDWQPLALTLSAGFGTVTNSSIWYRRDGDTMIARGTFKLGTVAANGSFFQLPFTIDTAKFSATANVQAVGHCWRYPSASTNFAGAASGPYPIYYDGSTSNQLWVSGNTTSNAITAQNVNSTFATGEAIAFQFVVPISGWSSNTVQSADTDTRVVSAKYYMASTLAVGTGASFPSSATIVNYDTKVWDTHAAVTTGASWTWMCPVSGYYQIKYQVIWPAFAGATIYLGNSTSQVDVRNSDNTNGVYQLAVEDRYFNAGEIFQPRAMQNSGLSKTLAAGASTGAGFICIDRVSGPAVVQATDTVAARYFASSTSISGSDATVVWTTKDYDLTNSMSSGSYTVPVSGKYQITSQVQVTATYSLNQNAQIGIFKNGVQTTGGIAYAGGANTSLAPEVSDIINCIAGDVITIKVNCSGTGPAIAASNTRNYVAIARVGN